MAMFHSRKKLLRAIREGDVALVREHLMNAERLDEWLGALNDDGFHALHIAVEHRQIALIPLLIDHGADVDVRTRSGRTPLMLATKHHSTDHADLLIARGANPKAADNDGLSVFGHAVYHQRTEVARLMLDQGAEIDDDKSFMHACSNRDVKTIALLIERGANTKVVQGSYNYHPVHYLAQHGSVEGFNVLQAANGIADLDARLTSDGNTALHMAAVNGHVGMVEILLAAGARRDLENNEGLTAEAAALKKDKRHCAKAIRAAEDTRPVQKPVAQEAPQGAATDENWLRVGAHSIAQVQTLAPLNRRITHLFNFESRERMTISENLKTGAEVTLPPQSFDDIDRAAIETAGAELQRQGGTVNDNLPGKPALRKTSQP
ncbi:MAG: ankyrin repeat domain-containing protein [Alphaproteobacteria bacterium]|nr:ankyrin repeat domain-containing protein [Alphaproteobacteria bacterium]